LSFSVIIPSRNASNLVPCVEAVRRAEPTAPIVVVDDGIDWTEAWHLKNIVQVIEGVKPFVFARNVNRGIQACAVSNCHPAVSSCHPEQREGSAVPNCHPEQREGSAVLGDIVLLNDDAILETPFGFHELEEASKAHPEFGVISAVTNVVGNLAQQPRDLGLREEPRTLAFVCVYIPRATIDRIGLLDERYVSYGWDDNDYCRRVREAGLKLGIFDDCFVDHSSLRSTFRGLPHESGDICSVRKLEVVCTVTRNCDNLSPLVVPALTVVCRTRPAISTPGEELYRVKWGDTA
jgi:hypothetical protein